MSATTTTGRTDGTHRGDSRRGVAGRLRALWTLLFVGLWTGTVVGLMRTDGLPGRPGRPLRGRPWGRVGTDLLGRRRAALGTPDLDAFSAAPSGTDRATTHPVLMVSTQGGHLAQLLALEGWYTARERFWICPDTPDVRDRLQGERVLHSHSPTTRNIPNLLRNAVMAWVVLRRERPSMVVSAGAGVAVPFFVVAWMLRIPTAFIEVFDRIDSPTMTGRLCGPFTTRRIVQWKSQQEFYPHAELVGPLL